MQIRVVAMVTVGFQVGARAEKRWCFVCLKPALGTSITNFCTDGGRLAGLSDGSYARSRDRSRCVDVKWSTGEWALRLKGDLGFETRASRLPRGNGNA